jgi:hypothetical protein
MTRRIKGVSPNPLWVSGFRAAAQSTFTFAFLANKPFFTFTFWNLLSLILSSYRKQELVLAEHSTPMHHFLVACTWKLYLTAFP